MSFFRVMTGFVAAMLIGIPFGLLLAVSRTAFGIGFPVFEVLRPIPPLAWVPASILFWPTQEMSIAFVTFLGAFFTIVINVVGGARSIDVRYFQAARSMGSSQSDIFWRIILPGTLPSIMVGSAVGMGITWEVVVAAEMISGGGSQIGGTSGGGLGFFIWNSYVGGSYEQIVVGHDQHRHRRLHLERAAARAGQARDAMAAAAMSGAKPMGEQTPNRSRRSGPARSARATSARATARRISARKSSANARSRSSAAS